MGNTATSRRRRFETEAVPFMQPLYRTAVHLTRSADEARDLVQETYLRAYRAFDQFTAGTNCKAWLFTIMHSIFNSAYRKARREQAGMHMLALDAEHELAAAGFDERSTDGANAAYRDPTDAQVERALAQLPEDFRAVVLLVDIGELSYEAAAAALQCPVGTVRSRLFRARGLLYGALQDYAREQGYAVAPEQT